MTHPKLPSPGLYLAAQGNGQDKPTIRVEILGPAAYAGPNFVSADVWLGVSGHIQPTTIRIAVDGSWRCPRELLPLGTCPCCLPRWIAMGTERLAKFRDDRGL